MKKIVCAIFCLSGLFAQDFFEQYLQFKEQRNFEIETNKLENPFLNSNFAAIQKLTIDALMLDKVKINGKWYKQGDTINEAQIIKIDAKQVIFQYDEIPVLIQFKSDGKISIR